MAKPKIPNQKSKYNALNRRLATYVAMVRRIYDTYNMEAAKMATLSGYDGEKPFKFTDYPILRDRTQKLFSQWRSELLSLITVGTSNEWGKSNITQDLLADKALAYYYSTKDFKRRRQYYQKNSDALKAFQQRKDNGLTLSQKIWNQSSLYKQGLEAALSSGIEKGIDAVTLSKRVSKYLNDFDSLRKDYKERYGKALETYDCEYRSIRLARSEINMAYRTAEQTRWQQFDFVVGYEIKLSTSHEHRMPHGDICDELKGKYHKDFVWTGWHPNDMCYCIPILKTYEEFDEGSDEPSVNEVTDVPNNYKEWIADNSSRIKEAEKRGTLPYWLKDNKTYKEYLDEDVTGNSMGDIVKSFINHITFKEDAELEQELTAFTNKQIRNHKKVSEIIGIEQGKRMSFKQADSNRSNPKYDWFDSFLNKTSPYNSNCPAAVVCHEMRLRGWNVTSLPFDSKNTTMEYMRKGKTEIAWIDPNTGKHPGMMLAFGKNKQSILGKFNKDTADVGRYHVRLTWKNGHGHILCIDRLPNGKLRIYDPQNNQLNLSDWIDSISYKKGLQYYRVDNLLINGEAVNDLVKQL